VYELEAAGFKAWVIPEGARLMQLWWLDAPHAPRPLCLGFQDRADYAFDHMAMGAVCGRYGNRIAHAQLHVGTHTLQLDANHALGHCIHGGANGFGVRTWDVASHSAQHIELRLTSVDGDQGFPGLCEASIRYTLSDDGALTWQARATVDRPCPINLVPHPYWNLDGAPDITGHRLWVNANEYLPLDALELPLGLTTVRGTPFDFTTPTSMAYADIRVMDAALRLREPPQMGLRAQTQPHLPTHLPTHLQTQRQRHQQPNQPLQLAATCEAGGLRLSVSTDRPFVHVYAAAGLTHQGPSPLGVAHQYGAGLCLETEDWPNGPANGRTEVWYDADHAYTHTAQWAFKPLP
jgi:aldose 1-epimerase